MKKADNLFFILCLFSACLIGVITIGFFLQLSYCSIDAWKEFGFNFIFSKEWDPTENQYGALPSIVGTMVTTIIALVIALPLSFAAALFIVDCRPVLGNILSHAIDLLAAIPSIIYGMWGLFVLVPLMQDHIQLFLAENLPFFSDDYNGFGLTTAGLILSIMILPYITAIMRDVLKMTPTVLREASYGIGCTKYEVSKDIVLRYGIRGILGGIFIGLGRALGETMAVLFVIGNVMDMPKNLFDSSTTISATLANNFAEADGLQRSSLFALGLILLAMCLLIQVLSQYYLKRGVK